MVLPEEIGSLARCAFFKEDGFLYCHKQDVDVLETADTAVLATLYPVFEVIFNRTLRAEGRVRELEKNHEKFEKDRLAYDLSGRKALEELNTKYEGLRKEYDWLDETNRKNSIWYEKKVQGLKGEICQWKNRCEGLEEKVNSLKTLPKQDQAIQAVVELQTCAVEARVPAASFERACQTTSPRGSEHGCCEEVVQTTNSISKLASRKCWKCGEKGHLRKDCRNKRKQRRSAPKADNLREVCASANQGGSQPSQTVWVFAISDVGGPQKMGGPVSLAHAPTPQPASISSVNLEEIVKLVLKSLKRKKKKRRQKNG